MKKGLRRLRRILLLLLRVLFVLAMVVCLIRFATATEVFDMVYYGIWFIIGLILTFRE